MNFVSCQNKKKYYTFLAMLYEIKDACSLAVYSEVSAWVVCLPVYGGSIILQKLEQVLPQKRLKMLCC